MPVATKTRTPKAASALGENELTGLFAEAFEAYDMADERVRFDSKNRRWQFRPDREGVHSTLHLELKRLEDVREDHISTAILGCEKGRPMIEDVVRKLDEALA